MKWGGQGFGNIKLYKKKSKERGLKEGYEAAFWVRTGRGRISLSGLVRTHRVSRSSGVYRPEPLERLGSSGAVPKAWDLFARAASTRALWRQRV